MLVLGVLLTGFACGLASRETHRFVHISEDGKKVAQDIIHDQEENTVLVIIGDVSMYKGYIPTVNLHDFNTGDANITKVYKAKDDPNPLTYDQVNWLAGPKIADFCKDYSTVFMQLIPEDREEKRDQTVAAQSLEEEPCRFICFVCVVKLDTTTHPDVFG